MKILFAGGGTAGHINPALAIAGYVRERQPEAEILYIGKTGGMEERLVPQAGFEFRGITVQGFSRKMTPAGIKNNIITVKKAITGGIRDSSTPYQVFTFSPKNRRILRVKKNR